MHAASQNGHVEAVRALVEAGAAVNQADVSASWGVGNACACVMCECMSVFVVVR